LFRKTPLKAQNDYIFYKFGGGMAPLALPCLRKCFDSPLGNFVRSPLLGITRSNVVDPDIRVTSGLQCISNNTLHVSVAYSKYQAQNTRLKKVDIKSYGLLKT